MSPRPPIYGLLAEFREIGELVDAVRATREAGFREIDAFTPFPIEEVAEALGEHENRLPFLVLIGGVLGGIFGYVLQYWTAVVDYPINVGGRPFHSWPSFLPITFECTVLGAALACVLGMLALNGLPTPYHPLFNVPRFALSTRDRFFLCIMSRDPLFDRERTRRFLERFTPRSLAEVDF
jgi:Alternative complex III, ActD subunit